MLSLDTTSGTVRHHPVPGGRPLRSYRLDAFDLTAPEVYEAAAGLAGPDETEGAVVRLFVNRARPELRRLLDRRQLAADAFAGALVVTVQVETDEDEQAAQLAAQPVTSLADEWDRYLAIGPHRRLRPRPAGRHGPRSSSSRSRRRPASPMHLRSLSLRNYRVYRSVDLEFPDGLIGIYGANGSGKTTLIESLRYALLRRRRGPTSGSCGRPGWGRTCGSSWCSSTRATPLTCGGG